MSFEIEELSADPTISSLIQWTKETTLWDGHQVTLEEAPHLNKKYKNETDNLSTDLFDMYCRMQQTPAYE